MVQCPGCGSALPPTGRTCSSCGADVSIWIARDNKVYGPYALPDFNRAQAEGRLSSRDLVRVGDLGAWHAVAEFLSSAAAPLAPSPPVTASGTDPRRLLISLAVGGAIVMFLIVVGAAVLFPVFARAREKARQASCQANEKQLVLALLMYCQDWDGCVPPHAPEREVAEMDRVAPEGSGTTDLASDYAPDNWRTLLYPYDQDYELYICPSTRNFYSYQLNDALYDLKLTGIASPGSLVALPEAGFMTGSPAPPHNGGYNVAFADGHVKWLRNREGAELTPGPARAGAAK